MTIKIGINGFGRMGRLILRAGWDYKDIVFIKINDPAGNSETFAHLLSFDSIHGKWDRNISFDKNNVLIDDQIMAFSNADQINGTDWSDCDLVIEASGQMRKQALLQQYLDQGVAKVLVTAPVADEEVINLVMGVNHHLYQYDKHHIVTASSCTTNCLAPVIQVIHAEFGIKHGSMTSIHDLTNTQTILDAPHTDLRRARACGQNLIPTTTGSAKAIGYIFPDLVGKLNGHAIRVPLANASLVDCVFELNKKTTVDEVNKLLQQASTSELKGILGFEAKPLVSVDYKTDPRSAIIDGLSTMVINGTQLKLYVWYDNEWGYVNRCVDLSRFMGQQFS